ncbi:MAG: MarR family winged helix-turn-helix transcriptional regulator [Bacillaceae bacterium]
MRRFGVFNKDFYQAEGHHISLVQSHILYEIDCQHHRSIQQVADTLGIDITTFSRQIQTLIKMNLVKKIPEPRDRRIYLLSLTAEGRQVANAIDQQMNTYLEELFSKMSDSEQDMVIQSIRLLNKSMEGTKRCCSTPLAQDNSV